MFSVGNLGFALGLVLAQPVEAGGRLVARDATTYGGAGMSMPTDVAVAADGRVFVADGVHDRVVVFRPDGAIDSSLRRVAGKSLSNPLALATGDDNLWIADTDNRRLLTVSLKKGTQAAVPLDPDWSTSVDMAGLAVARDESAVWLVDNDHHRVIVGDPRSGRWKTSGTSGESFGKLSYPAMIGLTERGEAFVSDVLNGRVHGFARNGRPQRLVARYGVTPGTLYHPRGIAIRGDQVWVSDYTGVIQVFTTKGALVDVLHRPDGKVLRFDMPAGLDFQGDVLYVTELGKDRVRSFRIESTDAQPLTQVSPRRVGAAGSEGRECTVCHLEWVPELVGGGATAIVPAVEDSEEQPYVTTSRACLSCHDGTVLDSREGVWFSHGHPMDVEPSDGMVVPEDMPLVNGKIACRTCHTAHTLGGSGEQHRDALMLRVSKDPNELCMACHTEQAETE